MKLGEQVWMAENLAYKLESSGCWAYNDNENHSITYGYLYNWYSLSNIAPAGWHVPSREEWQQLIDYLRNNGFQSGGEGEHKGVAISMAYPTGWNVSNGIGQCGIAITLS